MQSLLLHRILWHFMDSVQPYSFARLSQRVCLCVSPQKLTAFERTFVGLSESLVWVLVSVCSVVSFSKKDICVILRWDQYKQILSFHLPHPCKEGGTLQPYVLFLFGCSVSSLTAKKGVHLLPLSLQIKDGSPNSTTLTQLSYHNWYPVLESPNIDHISRRFGELCTQQ